MKSISLILSFVLTLGVAAKATEVLNLDSCQALAAQNYPLIKQYELIEKSKEFNIKNANKAYLPQVSFTGIAGYIMLDIIPENEIKFIGVAQLQQILWDGGATAANKQIIAAQSEVSKAQLDVDVYELQSRINNLFFGILLLNKQLEQLHMHAEILQQNSNKVQQMNANGLAYNTALQEIAVELLKLEQQKIELQHTRWGYIQMLSLLIGKPIPKETVFETPQSEDINTSVNRKELSLFNQQRQLILAQGKMTNVSLMPKVGLMGMSTFLAPGFQLGAQEMNSISIIGLSASWDLGGLYKHKNNKNLTEISLQQIDLQQEMFMYKLNQQTTQNNAEIEKQQAILAKDNQIVSIQQDIRKGYELQYESGVCTMLDLLTATENESQAINQQAMHEMQLLQAIYELNHTNGKQ